MPSNTRNRRASNSSKSRTSSRSKKVVVTSPKDALAYLRRYQKESKDQMIRLPGDRGSWATISMIVSHYKKNGQNLDRGWLGRALNRAAKESMGVKVAVHSGSNIYRVGKS